MTWNTLWACDSSKMDLLANNLNVLTFTFPMLILFGKQVQISETNLFLSFECLTFFQFCVMMDVLYVMLGLIDQHRRSNGTSSSASSSKR